MTNRTPTSGRDMTDLGLVETLAREYALGTFIPKEKKDITAARRIDVQFAIEKPLSVEVIYLPEESPFNRRY